MREKRWETVILARDTEEIYKEKKLIQLNKILPAKSSGSLKDKTLPFLSFISAEESFWISWKQIFDSEPNDKS